MSPCSAFAEMTMMASQQAEKFVEPSAHYSPLSTERLQQLGISARNYENQARYGLLDCNAEMIHQNDLNSQRDGLIREIMMYQADDHLKALKAQMAIEAQHSVAAQSALFLGSAYLFMNGKTFTKHLSENVDLSGNAKVITKTHALFLTRKNIASMGINSAIGYQMESDSNPTLHASLSTELMPHVVASVGQKRSLAGNPSIPSESTGEIHFGASF
jgi:hypothetical protein